MKMGDIELEGPLKRLVDKDPEIKKALEKIEETLSKEFKSRPWRHMDLLETGPDIVEALKPEKVPLKALRKWKGFSVFIGIWMIIALGILADWDLLNWRSLAIVALAIIGIEIWKREIEKDIEDRRGLKH